MHDYELSFFFLISANSQKLNTRINPFSSYYWHCLYSEVHITCIVKFTDMYQVKLWFFFFLNFFWTRSKTAPKVTKFITEAHFDTHHKKYNAEKISRVTKKSLYFVQL